MTTALRSLPGRLRRLASGGTASVIVSSLITNALRIVSSMTLTRLLSAEAFGVVGIITSVANVLLLVSDIGTGNFVLRHKEGLERAFLDQIWTLRLLRGLALTGAMLALAWPIARFMGKPELTAVLMVWSLYFVVDAASSLAFVTAVREQRLWRLTTLELAVMAIQLVVATLLAWAFHSYWSLVGAMLGCLALKSSLSYMLFPGARRRFTVDRPRARELWAFSRYIAMSSILTMLIMQSDKLVLARLMPLSAYGLYAIATTLAVAPVALAHAYANRILFPAYSEAMRAEPPRLAAIFYAKRRTVTLAFMFAVGGMIGGAKLLIAILYDPRYAAVTPYLQLVCVSTLLAMVAGSCDEAMIACGRQRYTLWANVARIAWLAIGGAIAWALGWVMLLVAVVGTLELAATVCYWHGLRREHILNLREEALGVAAAACGLAAGLAVAEAALWMLPGL